MLVLSRQKHQKVNFPGLGISVEILDIKGSKVRVGVDAPMEVRILRDEIPDRGDLSGRESAPKVIRLPRTLRHELKDALYEVGQMLEAYRDRGAAGGDPSERIEPTQMFEAIVDRIEHLSGHGVLSDSGVIAKSGAADAAPGRCSGKALLVDDDDNERELLAGFLRMCDYRVDTATDGLRAIDYLEKNEPPRAIVLDMQMPRCDGATFLRRIRKERAWDPIHVFVVSGHSPDEVGVPRDQGYTQWFDKPLDPRRVVDALGRVEAVA